MKVVSITTGDDDAELSDASPAKSERSFFSSPVLGLQSLHLRWLVMALTLLASSPLGQFSQSPTRFAPMAESTQMSLQGRFWGLEKQSHQWTHPCGVKTLDTSRQFPVSLGCHINSQYDVNGNADLVSHLLEKDVDFGAWIKDANDEDEEQTNGKYPGLNEYSHVVRPAYYSWVIIF